MILEQIDGPWIDELAPEDFPRQYQELAGLLPPRYVLMLADVMGGRSPVYLPKIDAMMVKHRNAKIKKDRKDGMSYDDLASKYRLTSVWIRQIVDHQEEDDKQLDMFATAVNQ